MKKLFLCIMLFFCLSSVCSAEELVVENNENTSENISDEVTTDIFENDMNVVKEHIYNIMIDDPLNVITYSQEEYNSLNSPVPLIAGTAYNGSFNSTALSYFNGVMLNNVGKDYVAFRGDRYNYYLYFGDISYNGSFSGSNLSYVLYNTEYGTISRGTDSLSISPGSAVVYSNVSNNFSQFTEVTRSEENRLLLIFIGVVFSLNLLFFIWRR